MVKKYLHRFKKRCYQCNTIITKLHQVISTTSNIQTTWSYICLNEMDCLSDFTLNNIGETENYI